MLAVEVVNLKVITAMEKEGREHKLSEKINIQFYMVWSGKTSRKRLKEIKAEITWISQGKIN